MLLGSLSRAAIPALAALLLGLTPAAAEIAPAATAALEAGREGGAFAHARALQDIAAANGGNRAAGTPGYDRSADYVADRLAQAGYAVRFEEFTFPYFEERSPPLLAAAAGSDGALPAVEGLRTLANSAPGDVSARLVPVDLGLPQEGAPPASTSGCEAADFAGFERGGVALVRRGTCPFAVKAENAAAAGAAGLVVMNDGVEGRTGLFAGTLGRAPAIPAIGIPYEAGRALAARAGDGLVVRLRVDVLSGTRTTRNVLAETPGGGERVIVAGAHLDSVPEGPGINDNGSGTAALLEAALRLARQPLPAGAPGLRFAFWGAEERGLIGSRHHVDALTEAQRWAILLYLNLDMVGSINPGRFVQASRGGTAGEGAPATAAAKAALLAWFRERGLPVAESADSTRGYGTDTASFIAKGVPTVGLTTGAGETKSEARAAEFGGLVGRPYDPCYHRACDTSENIDPAVLQGMSDALLHAIRTVATAPEPPRPDAQ